MKKIIITQLLYNIKKSHQFIFSLLYKKNYIRENEKNQEGKKILIWSKEKKNKKFSIFFKSIFERKKQPCFNKKIQPNLK